MSDESRKTEDTFSNKTSDLSHVGDFGFAVSALSCCCLGFCLWHEIGKASRKRERKSDKRSKGRKGNRGRDRKGAELSTNREVWQRTAGRQKIEPSPHCLLNVFSFSLVASQVQWSSVGQCFLSLSWDNKNRNGMMSEKQQKDREGHFSDKKSDLVWSD